jgi:hypothetical protein
MEFTLDYVPCVRACVRNDLEYLHEVIIRNVVITPFTTAVYCAESLRTILVALVFNHF